MLSSLLSRCSYLLICSCPVPFPRIKFPCSSWWAVSTVDTTSSWVRQKVWFLAHNTGDQARWGSSTSIRVHSHNPCAQLLANKWLTTSILSSHPDCWCTAGVSCCHLHAGVPELERATGKEGGPPHRLPAVTPPFRLFFGSFFTEIHNSASQKPKINPKFLFS